MDPILQTLFSWQFIVFGLALAAVVFIARKVVEYLMETYTNFNKEAKLWNDLILPVFPVVLGPIVGWMFKTFPYPDGLTTIGGRIIFGLVAGLLSGLLYRVVKAFLGQKIVALVGVTSTQPPAELNAAKPVIGSPDAPVDK